MAMTVILARGTEPGPGPKAAPGASTEQSPSTPADPRPTEERAVLAACGG